MKLNKKLLGIMYYLVVEGMENAKGKPIGYVEDLIELEKLLSKEIKK